MLDIERASILKRIAASLLDFILVLILSVGAAWLISLITNYNEHIDNVNEYYDYYNEKYDIDLLGTSDKYKDLTEEEQEAYDERLEQANLEYANDKEAIKEFNLVINLSIMIISVGLFFGIFITEFIIPLIFKNGQTVGKKIFSICVIKNDGVKVSTVQLFARTVIGKYVVELTGITEEMLQKEGVSFGEVMEQLKKYVGLSFKKSSFNYFFSIWKFEFNITIIRAIFIWFLG